MYWTVPETLVIELINPKSLSEVKSCFEIRMKLEWLAAYVEKMNGELYSRMCLNFPFIQIIVQNVNVSIHNFCDFNMADRLLGLSSTTKLKGGGYFSGDAFLIHLAECCPTSFSPPPPPLRLRRRLIWKCSICLPHSAANFRTELFSILGRCVKAFFAFVV